MNRLEQNSARAGAQREAAVNPPAEKRQNEAGLNPGSRSWFSVRLFGFVFLLGCSFLMCLFVISSHEKGFSVVF